MDGPSNHTKIYSRITCTQIRHLVVTLISAVLPEEAPKLASFMCHTSNQQQETYNDMLTCGSNVRMSNIVTKVLCNGDLREEDLDEAKLGM